jgi:hypothetical protein
MKIQIPITEDEAQDLLDGTRIITLTPPELPHVEIELVNYNGWTPEATMETIKQSNSNSN